MLFVMQCVEKMNCTVVQGAFSAGGASAGIAVGGNHHSHVSATSGEEGASDESLFFLQTSNSIKTLSTNHNIVFTLKTK